MNSSKAADIRRKYHIMTTAYRHFGMLSSLRYLNTKKLERIQQALKDMSDFCNLEEICLK